MRDFSVKPKKKRDDVKEYILLILLLSFAITLAASGKGAEFALGGIKLWAAAILPALFPYFFISAALGKLGVTEKTALRLSPLMLRAFNLPGIVSYALFTSLVSGFPVGAKIVSDLKNNDLITETESVRASALCSTASPAFVICGIGAAFSSARFGIALFFTHFFSSIIIGIIFSFYKRKEKPAKKAREKAENRKTADNILYECAYSAVISVLVVGGIITVFYVVTELLSLIGALTPIVGALTALTGDESAAKGLVFGMFECTKGIYALKAAGATKTAFVLAAAIIGFGGLSVIFQSLAYLKSAKIKTAPFILSKILGAAVNAMLAFVIYPLFF